jgi:hypothetical protein
MRPSAIAALVGLLLVVAWAMLVHVCAHGAGMGAAYRTCDCAGFEWELYDRTPADGPRKTLCLGIVRSTTCYTNMGGLEVDCPPT